MERAVLAVRDVHKAWGGRKIRRVLADGADGVPVPQVASIPAASTITAILRRHDRLDEEECQKHAPLIRFERSEPNALWQMDFKGDFALSEGGRCHPWTLLDDHSRFCLGLAACPNEQGHTARGHLIGAFREFGLPDQMLMDNGPPWGGGGVMRYTYFAVWLMRLGIIVSHGRPWHPQTQGKDERFHRTLMDEVIRPELGLSVRWNVHASATAKPGASTSQSGKRVCVADCATCQEHFDRFRALYNNVRPHEALGMQTPASRYQPSPRPYPEELLPVQYDQEPGQSLCRVRTGGILPFGGRTWFLGIVLAGQPVAVRHAQQDGLYHVFFCRQRIATIDLTGRRDQVSYVGETEQCVTDLSEHV